MKLHHRILSAVLVVVMLLGLCPVVSFAADRFAITREGKAITELTFPENEKITVAASNLPEGSYQWQIQVPGQELWVNISGQTGAELTLSYALLGSLLDQDNSAAVRCAAIADGEEVEHTAPLRATVTEPVEVISSETVSAMQALAPEPLPAPTVEPSEEPTADEEAPVALPSGEGGSEGTGRGEDALPETTEETPDELATDDAGMTSHAPTEETPVSSLEKELSATQTEDGSPESTDEPTTEEPVEEEPSAEEPIETDPETELAPETETDPTSEASAAAEDVVLSSDPQTAETLAADGDSTETVTVTIEYVYSSASKYKGQIVAQAYIAELPKGEGSKTIVTSPECVGYEPNLTSIKLEELGAINANVTMQVEYSPAKVSYTVRHYQQNISDDDYTWVDTTLVAGFTEAQTSEAAAITYEGFKALPHVHEEIAADSSTMIDIYYDREYYLMHFDLDGGYGADPIYARFGTPISVGTPSKTGWDFLHWDLMVNDTDGDGILDSGDGTKDILPGTMPSKNTSYKAKWTSSPTGTKYTVAYWINNDDGTKTYITSKDVVAQAGEEVHGVDDVCGIEVHEHTDSCGIACGITEHSHGTACISGTIKIGSETAGAADINAMVNANGGLSNVDGVYLYFIQTQNDINNSKYWPKLYVGGKYYDVTINSKNNPIDQTTLNSVVTGTATQGYVDGYWAYRYAINSNYITCGITEHSHDVSCSSCGKAEHAHTSNCSLDIARHLVYVGSDTDDKTIYVAGDGSTVVNVYYTYKEYTIRYVYARKNTSNQYQIATKTNEGGFDNCEWTTVTDLPNATSDPSGATPPSSFVRTEDGYTYYYISLKAKFGAYIGDKWPANNIDPIDSYKFGSWAAAPGTPYRLNSTLNANIVGAYSTMSADMIVSDPEELPDGSYLAQNMIAWWGSSSVIGNHAYHNFFEVLSAPDGYDIGTTPEEIDGETYVKYGDKIYKLDNLTFQVAHNADTRVDPLEFNGYTVINNNPTKQASSQNYANNGSCMICETSCAYCNTFYYDRNPHTLKFYNRTEWLSGGTGVQVPFGTPLAIYESGTDSSQGATAMAIANYPNGLEDNVYKFIGWYTTADCHDDSAVDWTTITMPDADLTLYAKWERITHQITVQLSKDDTTQIGDAQSITNGSYATAPDTPTNGDEEFLGWFYLDANNVEQAFSFASTPVTEDLVVYAKWRSTKMKEVQIHYAIKNADGTYTEIADTETMMLRVGQVRTFDAKTGNSLYADYRTGCFPTLASHSITPTEEDFNKEAPLVYTFLYKQYETVPYQVEFYVKIGETTNDKGETVPLLRPAFKVVDGKAKFVEKDEYDDMDATEKESFEKDRYIEQHWDNDKAAVTEIYVPEDLADLTWTLPDEYLPNALRIPLIVVPAESNAETTITEHNTIKFIYTYTAPDPDVTDPTNPDPGGGENPAYQARYTVQHFIQSPTAPETYTLYSYLEGTGLSGTQTTEVPISIPGYEYNSTVTGTKMGDYNDARDWADGLTAEQKAAFSNTLATDPDAMTGTITADDKLELNFYYNVRSYPYQIRYLEKGTDRVLLATTGSDGSRKANYGSQVTYTLGTDAENALLEDYSVDATSKSLYIQMEADENVPSINTITFYYTRKSADLIITKEVALDETQAQEAGISKLPDSAYTQEFEFTIDYPKGFYKSVYDCVHTDRDGKETETTVIAQTKTITVKLKAGESIRIKDLDMGTYTVKETYVPGFRITVDGGSDAQQREDVSITAELINAGEDVPVKFTNSYPFFTGDLVLGKTIAKVSDSDPTATDPYKMTVTLTPADAAREIPREITWTDTKGDHTETIPALAEGETGGVFTYEVWVEPGKEVTMYGVPAGKYKVEETPKGTVGFITDFYSVNTFSKLHNNEETIKDSGSVVEGDFHGGHTTTVTFNNTYKKGDLTVKKVVTQEYVNDSWKSDTFDFTIEGTTELPDGKYTILVDGAEQIAEVADGKLTLTDSITVEKPENTTATSWENSLTFEDLPAGYYTVTETENNKFTTSYVYDPENGLVNKTDDPAEITVTNTFKRTTGNLQVSKEITKATTDATIDTNQEFTFEVKLKDSALTGSYAYTIKSGYLTATTDDDTVYETGSLPVADNKLTFKLKHDQYILITGLPVGEYAVSELGLAGYQSSFGVVENGNYTVDPATITTNNTTKLDCKNSYPVYYSDLVIEKVVKNSAQNSTLDSAPTSDVFHFEVKISGYSANLKPSSVAAQFSDKGTADTLTVTNDVITFDLKAGQSVKLNLPVCNYTVTETGMTSTVNTTGGLEDHYDVSCKLGTETGTTSIGSELLSGQEETVTFTNTYKQHLADLTIQQAGEIGANESGIYTVTKKDETDPLVTVILTGVKSVTITQIPVGEYVVAQHSGGWTWAYTVNNQSVDVSLNANHTVTFEYTEKSVDWLHDESKLN